jgi:hypothetical protein
MRAVPDVLAAQQNVAGVRPANSLQFSHRIRLLILIEWRPARSPQMVPSGLVGIRWPLAQS